MNKKLTPALTVAIALTITGAYLFTNSTKTNTKITKPNEQITTIGTITCIPKISDGLQTTDCALELRRDTDL